MDLMVFVVCVVDWLGLILLEIVVLIGFGVDMFVICGIYDFNVFFYVYFVVCEVFFFVVLMGMWVIFMVVGGVKVVFDLVCDMLVNVNVYGDLVLLVCFMGGCEFECLIGDGLKEFFFVDMDFVLVCVFMLLLVVEN